MLASSFHHTPFEAVAKSVSRNAHNGVVIADFITRSVFTSGRRVAVPCLNYLETAGVYDPNKYYPEENLARTKRRILSCTVMAARFYSTCGKLKKNAGARLFALLQLRTASRTERIIPRQVNKNVRCTVLS